jgi:peptidoglycan/xylan/chitin deacetylase (PgdA/CDA1 family)
MWLYKLFYLFLNQAFTFHFFNRYPTSLGLAKVGFDKGLRLGVVLCMLMLVFQKSVSQENPSQPAVLSLTINFDQVPQKVEIEKAFLRFNKDFAYSITFDDGYDDAYTAAFQLLKGGKVKGNGKTYPGLFYTDGCGNKIAFKAGIAWNSVNSQGKDLGNNVPGFITWNQLRELYENGWDILNHSYSHASGPGTNYNDEVVLNFNYVKQKTGIEMTHFVIPSGDDNYTEPAFDQGVKAVFNQNYHWPGREGLLVDDKQPERFIMYRYLLDGEKHSTDNVSERLDEVALKSSGQHPYWWSEFTHRVGFTSTGASIVFPIFEHHMQYVENTYGQHGKDNVWVAPLQEVHEYLLVRDKIDFTVVQEGKKVIIDFDLTNLPKDLRRYSLTLKVEAEENFQQVQAEGVSGISFKGNGTGKIINIEFEHLFTNKGKNDLPEPVLAFEGEKVFEQTVQIYPNPVDQFITIVDGEGAIEQYMIYHNNGTLLASESLMPYHKGEINIDLSPFSLSSGIYLIRVKFNNGQQQVLRFVKR